MSLLSFKKLALGIALSGVIGAPSIAANAANYTIDPSHSFIEFRTKHLGYSWLTGRFGKFSGTMNYDPAGDASAQSVKVSIDTSSVDTYWAARVKHLRMNVFFNTAANAVATFESTGYSGDASGGTLKGNLTILGVTKEISFPIAKIGEGKDPWGGYRVGFEGSYTVTRKDFGMDFNLGPQAEKVEVSLMIEAIKDK